MSQYLQSVEKFVALLQQHIIVEDIRYSDSYVFIKTDKVVVYIYFPGTERLLNLHELPIIHIDIDRIINQSTTIIYRLKGLHGLGQRIYARKTVVARIDKRVATAFLDEHHLQGAMPGKYRYGLFYEGELVSAAVFSGGRIMRDISSEYRSFELIRFCHKGDALVVGGISKLIKAFIADFNPQDIMTYADRDWCSDSSLERIGFQVVGNLDPFTQSIKNGKRVLSPSDHSGIDYSVANLGSIKLKLVL